MNKKTKLVTAYYAYHNDPPFWGQINRNRRYKYSLISLCLMGVEVICYTDNYRHSSVKELEKLKEKFNLDTLTIKVFPLENNPWHERVVNIRKNNNPEKYNNRELLSFYHGSAQIYWSKFKLLEMELEPNTNIYWIDSGLCHPGLFSKQYSKWGDLGWDNQFAEEGKNYFDIEYRFHYYDKAFTPEKLQDINKFSEGKIINLCIQGHSDNDMDTFIERIVDKEKYPNVISNTNFPVGGFFGGNSTLLAEYIQHAYDIIDKVLDTEDYLTVDQEILWYLYVQYPEMVKNFYFNTYYHDDWDFYNKEHYGVPFEEFFTKPLTLN